MMNRFVGAYVLLLVLCCCLNAIADQPTYEASDWLIDGSYYKASFVTLKGTDDQFVLGNGLVQRKFLLKGNVAACIGLQDATGKQLLRAVKPEAILTIDGEKLHIGGLVGQPNHAYLRKQWLGQMTVPDNALELVGYKVSKPEARFPWNRVRHHDQSLKWPPSGVKLSLEFKPKTSDNNKPHKDLRIFVHYELYDGVPVLCKWVTLENRSDKALKIDRFSSEVLAIVEEESWVESRSGVGYPTPQSLHVETDFAFGGFNHQNANRHVVHWRPDPEYKTQVNYKRETPNLLIVEPTYGPAQIVKANGSWSSFRTFELVYDSTERERRSLSLRRMYRTIAPWVTENPLMHHLRESDSDSVRRAIKDASEVGFEMIILSFGSGFNIENDSPEYVRQWKEIADLAKQKGVEIGGYSLLSSRKIGNGNDIVSPTGLRPTHGNCPALTSEWGQAYYKNLYRFFEETGFTLLEHDGPYPGDVDVTSRPPLQRGEADSRWVQAGIANKFYRWCREKGIYVNAPDYYYLNGTNKCGMGYREVNWSLPREMQLIHTRQNIFDGTWTKTPSMGWMFVPLSEYHGGGAAATIEPLEQHLDHYEAMMQSNLGLGVQACFRGPRLFDSQRTKAIVKRNVDWFIKYRDILESDLIHGRRADGQQLDWMLHVNPALKRKGLLTVYNPTSEKVSRTIKVNLYYTGLKDHATIKVQDEKAVRVTIDRNYDVNLQVEVSPKGMNWIVIE